MAVAGSSFMKYVHAALHYVQICYSEICTNGEMNVSSMDTGSLTPSSKVKFSQLPFSRNTKSSKFYDHVSYTEFYAKKTKT
jgi:hypothetical protein